MALMLDLPAPIMLRYVDMDKTQRRRVGRPVAIDPRRTRVVVRLTAAETLALDQARGTQSAAAYIRSLITVPQNEAKVSYVGQFPSNYETPEIQREPVNE